MKKSFGVGTAHLTIANSVFIASNYLIHIVLAKFLGPEQYGLFGVLMSLYLINRAFLNTGIPRAVSKFISEKPKKFGEIYLSSLKLQIISAIIFSLLYVLFAPLIADFLNENSLVQHIRFLGIIIIPLALVSLYLNGFINGKREFSRQALLRIFYALMRTTATISLVLLGFKLMGALWGYFLAVTITLIASHHALKFKKVKTKFPTSKIIKFAIPITITALLVTLIRNMNVLLIKKIIGDNVVVGLYTAAATLSNASYLLFSSLPLTLLPSISSAISNKNHQKIKDYITQSFRYIILVGFPIAILTSIKASDLLTIFYSETYANAGTVLGLLVIGSTLLTLLVAFTAIITGSNKPGTETLMMLGFLMILLVLDLSLIPLLGIEGAALAFLITTTISCLIAGTYVFKKFNVKFKFLSTIRIVLSILIISVVANSIPTTKYSVIPILVVLMVIYFLILSTIGEFNKRDGELIKKLLRFKSFQ